MEDLMNKQLLNVESVDDLAMEPLVEISTQTANLHFIQQSPTEDQIPDIYRIIFDCDVITHFSASQFSDRAVNAGLDPEECVLDAVETWLFNNRLPEIDTNTNTIQLIVSRDYFNSVLCRLVRFIKLTGDRGRGSIKNFEVVVDKSLSKGAIAMHAGDSDSSRKFVAWIE